MFFFSKFREDLFSAIIRSALSKFFELAKQYLKVNLIIAILCHFVSFHLLPWYHLKIVQHQKFIKGVVLADVTKAQHFFVGGLRQCSNTQKSIKKVQFEEFLQFVSKV